MGLQPLPPAWCKAVKAGIDQGRLTNDCHRRWQRDFPGSWRFDLNEALRKALSSPSIKGCLVHMAEPPGETWEFFFELQGVKTYGKILLRTDKKRVVIFSAHKPGKAKLHCE